jgi:hypothetical protein
MWCACLGLETKHVGPRLRLWARGSPSFLKALLLPSPSRRGGWRAAKAHGLDRQAGGGTACGRAWACNGTPRALRRANAASSAYASVSDRAAPGAVCPWKVCPDAARGSGLRNHPPAGCRSRSPLSRRLMKTPSTMDRDGPSIITLPVKSTAISLLVNECGPVMGEVRASTTLRQRVSAADLKFLHHLQQQNHRVAS